MPAAYKQLQRSVMHKVPITHRQWAAAELRRWRHRQISQMSENLRLLERLKAFNEHDLDRIMEHFSDDCSLNMPRESDPWGTRYTGKAAVRQGSEHERFDRNGGD